MAQQVKKKKKNPPAMQDTQESWVQFLGQEDPLEKETATHSRMGMKNPCLKNPMGRGA